MVPALVPQCPFGESGRSVLSGSMDVAVVEVVGVSFVGSGRLMLSALMLPELPDWFVQL